MNVLRVKTHDDRTDNNAVHDAGHWLALPDAAPLRANGSILSFLNHHFPLSIKRQNARRVANLNLFFRVHDEVVLEAPDEELTQIIPLVRQIMTDASTLTVPLKVDIEVGQNWLEMESYNWG